MFCFQCQQTAKNSGCTTIGVCGKTPEVSEAQDLLTCEIISLAKAIDESRGTIIEDDYIRLIIDGLFTCVTNVNFDSIKILDLVKEVQKRRLLLKGDYLISSEQVFGGDADLVSCRSLLLFGLRGMAAYAHHARVLGKKNEEVNHWFIKGLASLSRENSITEWLSLIMELGSVNLKCMKMLDLCHVERYGNPIPTNVAMEVEKGPFIVVSGHDLYDLEMLLQQTEGYNINIYTHGEMLPAHGYPELKKYSHLKGNFGTAWQNQQTEFAYIPAPILFTTNCIMQPKESYKDRVYTTSVVCYPEIEHIEANSAGYKHFDKIINHAIMLGGYSENKQFKGVNGGTKITTGFGHQAILKNADLIVNAVKSGDIRHFYLVGGCDGHQSSRSYYTDFVKQTPPNTIVLTLACGKYRFNDLDCGNIGPLPRILDMGQCNDAFGAINVAITLANVFKCGINELPLTMVLSWYEQKAVCILLTLLSLGVKNIILGPTLPAFISKNVLEILVDKFAIQEISTPNKDMN